MLKRREIENALRKADVFEDDPGNRRTKSPPSAGAFEVTAKALLLNHVPALEEIALSFSIK